MFEEVVVVEICLSVFVSFKVKERGKVRVFFSQTRRTDRKPCKVCNFTRQKLYGVVVPSLVELKQKCDDLVAVVLEKDGTIVENQAYFLCLPLNTKLMLLHEKETYTAWMAQESGLAQQLKQDMASIILMSKTSVDALWSELASALGFQERKEERQSKELLQLYLKAAEKANGQQEESRQPGQGGTTVASSGSFHFDLFEKVILNKDLGHFVLALLSEEHQTKNTICIQ
uniref:CIDE-N domain-containing protein n=1 Tax=Stegastes partitus TaxID=144197 RepID=A0A3B4ZY44_9TELE